MICSDPFRCDCHLTWLLRDNRHLMSVLNSAECDNGTSFFDLDELAFDGCPPAITRTTSRTTLSPSSTLQHTTSTTTTTTSTSTTTQPSSSSTWTMTTTDVASGMKSSQVLQILPVLVYTLFL